MSDNWENWDCEAYGAEGRAIGAVCFFAFDACLTGAECHARMTATRGEIWARMQELAAAGDPLGVYLAGEFSSPDELLGGRPGADETVVRAVLRMSAKPLSAFNCPRCGATSANPNDRREGYCGRCHDWTGKPAADG